MKVGRVELFRLCIPFRFSFAHHAARRRQTDNLIVKITLANGICGYGEGVPREYVTGETPAAAADAVRRIYFPFLALAAADDFAAAVNLASRIPFHHSGNIVFNAARCAAELALLDAYGCCFGESLAAARDHLADIPFTGGSLALRPSGVLPLVSPRLAGIGVALLSRLWRLRDFKLKWGTLADDRRFRLLGRLAPRAAAGKITVRIDANGAWTLAELLENLDRLSAMSLESIEQPFAAQDLDAFAGLLQQKPPFKVTVDESVRTVAEVLLFARRRLCQRINIRISKMGGFIPALRMVQAARDNGLEYQLGSMVGESGILAAAFDHFLAVVPDIRFSEPSFRRWLLKDDPAPGRHRDRPGLGIEIVEKKLRRYAEPAGKAEVD